MLTFALVLIAGLILLGAGIGTTLTHIRAERHELHRRTDLAIHSRPAAVAVHPPGGLRPYIVAAGHGFRRLYAIGLPFQWGMRAGAATLVLVGLGGGGLTWILLHALLHLPLWLAGPLTLAALFFIPRQILKMQQNKAEQTFLNLFPDTIDMIVRMVRAGIPIMAAIRTVGEESLPPVAGVFTSLADQVEIGIMFEEALVQVGERIGLADFRFFAVAVSLQHSTGGNIASTLEILSEIIRKRRAARLKAKSTSSEVRVSAFVLGSLPILVIGGLLLTSPAYLAPLVTDPRGNVIIGAAIISLGLGFLTMREMMRRATQM